MKDAGEKESLMKLKRLLLTQGKLLLKVCKKVIKIVAHAGRKTVTVEDIEFVCE